MQRPSDSVSVAWYRQLAALGEGGNVVMAGNDGSTGDLPGVFARLDELGSGDAIAVLTVDGSVHGYAVASVRTYAGAAEVPLPEVVGETPEEALTLITGGRGAERDTPVVIVGAERMRATGTPVP